MCSASSSTSSSLLKVSNCTIQVLNCFTPSIGQEWIKYVKWIPLQTVDREFNFDRDCVIGTNSFYAYGQKHVQRGVLGKTKFRSHSFCVLLQKQRINIRLFNNNSAILTGCVDQSEVRRALKVIADETSKLDQIRIKVKKSGKAFDNNLIGAPLVSEDWLVYNDDGSIIGHWREHCDTYYINSCRTQLTTLDAYSKCVASMLLNDFEMSSKNALCFVEKKKTNNCTDPLQVFSTRGILIGHLEVESMFNTTKFIANSYFHSAIHSYSNVASSTSTTSDYIISTFPPVQLNTAGMTILQPSNMLASDRFPITSALDISTFVQDRLHWQTFAQTVRKKDNKNCIFNCILSKKVEINHNLLDLDCKLNPMTFGVSECKFPIRKCEDCKKVTICIFKSGGIIVTGLQQEDQVEVIRKFLVQFYKND